MPTIAHTPRYLAVRGAVRFVVGLAVVAAFYAVAALPTLIVGAR